MNYPINEYSFVRDVVLLLRANVAGIKQSASSSFDFEKGRLFAYYEVLSLIQQQAKAFGIDMAEINMQDFNADRDVL
ncbi:MAG: hypothetical protein R3C14_22575 [Caldilineaceae bacterium]